MPEKYKIVECEKQATSARLVEVQPGENVLVAEIPISWLRTLKTGEWDIWMSFTRGDGTSFTSESMPFTEEALAEYSLSASTGKQ